VGVKACLEREPPSGALPLGEAVLLVLQATGSFSSDAEAFAKHREAEAER